MNPTSPDPSHPVPEISPGDDWHGAEDFVAQLSPEATVLPLRRPPAGGTANAKEAVNDSNLTGLRIAPKPRATKQADVTPRPVVHEIDGSCMRLDPAPPVVPKVARHVAFLERPVREWDESSSAGESSTWGKGPKLSKLWILYSGLAVVAAVILSLCLLPFINSSKTSRVTPTAELAEDASMPKLSPQAVANVKVLEVMLKKRDEARKICQIYLTATQAEEILPVVFDRDAMAGLVRSQWQPLGLPKPWVLEKNWDWVADNSLTRPCAILKGNLPDYSPFVAYFIDDGDRLALDWKATVAYSTATFAQLEKNEGDPTEIRGEISPATYYSPLIPEADYYSFRLTAADGKKHIWCYSRRDSPASEVITPFFRRGRFVVQHIGSLKVTLRLERGPAGLMPNQWLIGEVINPHWVTR